MKKSFKDERDFSNWVREKLSLADFHNTPIENAITSGMPDLHAYGKKGDFFIELKRGLSKAPFFKIRPSQFFWMRNRLMQGGDTLLLCYLPISYPGMPICATTFWEIYKAFSQGNEETTFKASIMTHTAFSKTFLKTLNIRQDAEESFTKNGSRREIVFPNIITWYGAGTEQQIFKAVPASFLDGSSKFRVHSAGPGEL